eukprot:Skav204559  [mRNA]  locus=scaffold2682:47665:48777:+ [translate_table: standard]
MCVFENESQTQLWNSTQTQQSCENEGKWIGCTGKIDLTAARCGTYTHDECILNSDICNWVGSCECGPDHFGQSCSKELVEFNSQAPQGFCRQEQADLYICRGFVYASSSAERHLCEGEGTKCGPWQELKEAVASIREAEIGDIIVDSLGILFLLVAARFRGSNRNDSIFLASIANFIADIILEARLVIVSAEAIKAVAPVRDSFCFSYGDGTASLVTVEDLVDWIVTYAWTNIVLATCGTFFELVGTFFQMCGTPRLSLVALILVAVSAVLELALGALSFTQYTQELIAEINFIESAALGQFPFEEGYACFVRSSDAQLPDTDLIGVEWSSLLWLILPLTLVFLQYIMVICIACRQDRKRVQVFDHVFPD